NRPEWVVALWGCILAGVVAVPVDFRSSSAMGERIATIVSAKVLLIGDELQAPSGLTCPARPIRDAHTGAAAPGSFAVASPDDIAESLFTSGATGDPRGVTITHRN